MENFPDCLSKKLATNYLHRFLRPLHRDMKHSDKVKLPNGLMLVPMKGDNMFEVGDLLFQSYYVSVFANHSCGVMIK